MIDVKIVNESKYALPEYETEGSAGVDLRADVERDVEIHPGHRALISTGLRMAIPKGYEGQVRPRSGLALKSGITVLNSPGTVDSDYRGVVGVILINNSNEMFTVKPGMRIGQMVFQKYERAEFVEVENLSQTERGDGGFGHTGV